MQEITLEALLEAGCHFGHKSERWHPKAAEFIWVEKDGIHIIDLAKTKAGLEAAMNFVHTLASEGKSVLFVGTKRQARGVVHEAAEKAGAAYLTQRWIGGFMTNWESVHRNIQKIKRLMEERAAGAWKKKYPKHEQTKLSHYLDRLNVDYGGVLSLDALPAAIFVVDVRKEQSAVREAQRMEIPVIGIVDTNANPDGIDFVIPANDDAVGSVEFIVNAVTSAYHEGCEVAEKEKVAAAAAAEKAAKKAAEKVEPKGGPTNLNGVIKAEKVEAPVVEAEKPAEPNVEEKPKKAAKAKKA
jgi:small subunit ribosomal protein S2